MKFFKKYKITPLKALKVTGIGLVALIVLVVAIRFVSSTLDPVMGGRSFQSPELGYDGYYEEQDFALSEKAFSTVDNAAFGLPVPPIEPTPDFATGVDAEDFEITEYNTTIDAKEFEETCEAFLALKAKEYVVFENANEYEESCYYSFKVKNANVDEILAIIESYDPKDFSEYSYTIKKTVDNYSSETEILLNKLNSIESTLEGAIVSYDEIAKIATDANNVESLATLIDSKIQLIERLTQEKIRVNEQLSRIARSMSDQLDRLEFTYFYVNIYEDKYVDFEDIADSWKWAVKDLVDDTNSFVQNVSVNLIVFILYIIQYALYLFILLFVAKYGWKFGKYVWKK